MEVLPRFLRLALCWATHGMLICRLRHSVCLFSRSDLMSRMRRRTSAIHSMTAVLYHGGFVVKAPETSLQRVRRWIELEESSTHRALPTHVLPVRALSRSARSAPRAVGCFGSYLFAVVASQRAPLRALRCSCCSGKPVTVGPNQFACQRAPFFIVSLRHTELRTGSSSGSPASLAPGFSDAVRHQPVRLVSSKS